MFRFAIALLAVIALMGLGAPAPAHAADGSTTASEITLLFHGSLQGEITDCGCKNKPLGGLARRAALVEATRAECNSPDCCLLLDAGSLLGRTDEKGMAQTSFLVDETARLGYAAVGVGPWDLRHGLAQLHEIEGQGIRYTNANLLDAGSGEPAFEPYRIETVNGVRVALISVASEAALSGIELDGLRLRAPREALQRTLPELRAKSDLVVLLAQMKTQELRELLLDLEGNPLTAVDVAVEGMGTKRYARPNRVGDTWLLAANNRGKVLGEARLIVAEDGELLDLDLDIHELELALPEDPGVAERVQQFQEGATQFAGTR